MELEEGQIVHYILTKNLSWAERRRLSNATYLSVRAVVTGFDENGNPNLDILCNANIARAHVDSADIGRLMAVDHPDVAKSQDGETP